MTINILCLFDRAAEISMTINILCLFDHAAEIRMIINTSCLFDHAAEIRMIINISCLFDHAAEICMIRWLAANCVTSQEYSGVTAKALANTDKLLHPFHKISVL